MSHDYTVSRWHDKTEQISWIRKKHVRKYLHITYCKMKTAWKEHLRKESWKNMERNTYNKTSTKSPQLLEMSSMWTAWWTVRRHVHHPIRLASKATPQNFFKRLESMFHLQPHRGMKQRWFKEFIYWKNCGTKQASLILSNVHPRCHHMIHLLHPLSSSSSCSSLGVNH